MVPINAAVAETFGMIKAPLNQAAIAWMILIWTLLRPRLPII
jgi:hypothetical protein